MAAIELEPTTSRRLGALRAAAQLIAYELPLVLAVVGVVVQAGTMSLQGIVLFQQGGHLFGWSGIGFPLILTQFVGFGLFMIAAQAELTQPPFDDIHVRRAMNWIMDKQALVQGWGGPTIGAVANHIVPNIGSVRTSFRMRQSRRLPERGNSFGPSRRSRSARTMKTAPRASALARYSSPTVPHAHGKSVTATRSSSRSTARWARVTTCGAKKSSTR